MSNKDVIQAAGWVVGDLPIPLASGNGLHRLVFCGGIKNLQTHGGKGFTWEADCHLHLRRARQLALALGGLPIWREWLIRTLGRRNTP